ncbi:MAG: cupin domain-containing protein [Candidatus Paceibacterota bacterium]|jgi:mannose-6-phosphate isomerase-like protein (cupin superfamily)
MEKKNKTVLKPWGKEIIIEKRSDHWIKKLVVRQDAELSLQSHQDRTEIWIVLSGKIKVIKGSKQQTLKEGDFIKIDKKEKHRIIGLQDSVVLETALGRVRQNDITRFKDDYGRVD